MDNKHRVPPHNAEEDQDHITQLIKERVEAIWATAPALMGVNFEIEQRLAEERRKKVAIINEILEEVAIHLKQHNARLSKAEARDVMYARQQLSSLAAESRQRSRKAPLYWLMILAGGIMALALLLEVAVAFEWFALLWRDERGQLSAEYFVLAMFFALLTALVIGVILHRVLLQMPRWLKNVALVVLALLAISIIIAAPLSVVMMQPGMTGNSLIVGDGTQQPLVEQLSQLAMANRALLFLLAAAVATLGIALLVDGARGLTGARQARREAAEHEKLLQKLAEAEQISTAIVPEEQRKRMLITYKFNEALRCELFKDERRLKRYLRGERLEPMNREQLNERLHELTETEEETNADDVDASFVRQLAKRYMPTRLNLADLPPANELPPQARAWIEKHAQWLQWLATQTHQRLQEEE